ncbi:MAG: UDP-N-acetylmuramoyl-L-alanyl-D-glutamate--2,6-diaminopimelate ligase [Clostridiales bacterium]|nr:UDP-N-acetylmuramoyl-L-alanyl-D-glutamate--2,6-diaminopimelate ligase [Clostridiales bacterium]
MELDKLLNGIQVERIIGNKDIDVKDVVMDSKNVTNNSLYICIKGKEYDGHDFIDKVVNYGCIAIVSEKELDTSVTQIIVQNSRSAMAKLASNFYGNVDEKMKLVAVVGTNGKTTTSHLIKDVLESSNVKCGVIGTLGIYYCDKYFEPTLTTPDPLELHRILFNMYECGVECVVMEVSAHAIFYEKVKNLKFHTAVFTNFSQDHLDFFENMENYKNTKLKFFKENECKCVVSNSDDQVGNEISKLCKNCITYGLDNPADIFAVNISCKPKKTTFFINVLDFVGNIQLKMLGFFNVYNALACAGVCYSLGIKQEKIIEALNRVKTVSGRLENVYSGEFDVIIDYAHTPDGLNKSLLSVRPFVSNRLICVFGCGGNRDVTKRSVMGEISGALADFTIITSDNPRFEEPMEIICQIEQGVSKKTKKYLLIEDREDAIKYALDVACKGDIILIAGKGSETYQEVLGIKIPYNDKDTVKEILRSMGF